jgi:arylsulfatase A-like enzyme
VRQPVCTLDYLPTLTDLLNFEMPDDRPIDGTSILSLLRGEDWKREKFIPFASQMQKKSPSASIIQGEYKLLLWPNGEKEDELYHLNNDPGETNNLARLELELAASLKEQLQSWLKSARQSYEEGDYPGYEKQGNFVDLSR